MKHDRPSLCSVLAILAVAVGLAAAAPAPYDFSGHWTGTITDRGQTIALTVDFVATSNPRNFTGTSTLSDGLGHEITCTFTAHYRRKLKLHSKCSDGTASTVTGVLDAATQTVSGSFVAGHRHKRLAHFTATRTG